MENRNWSIKPATSGASHWVRLPEGGEGGTSSDRPPGCGWLLGAWPAGDRGAIADELRESHGVSGEEAAATVKPEPREHWRD